jgi:hypothetical protein
MAVELNIRRTQSFDRIGIVAQEAVFDVDCDVDKDSTEAVWERARRKAGGMFERYCDQMRKYRGWEAYSKNGEPAFWLTDDGHPPVESGLVLGIVTSRNGQMVEGNYIPNKNLRRFKITMKFHTKPTMTDAFLGAADLPSEYPTHLDGLPAPADLPTLEVNED